MANEKLNRLIELLPDADAVKAATECTCGHEYSGEWHDHDPLCPRWQEHHRQLNAALDAMMPDKSKCSPT
jgi:hypothetical protein